MDVSTVTPVHQLQTSPSGTRGRYGGGLPPRSCWGPDHLRSGPLMPTHKELRAFPLQSLFQDVSHGLWHETCQCPTVTAFSASSSLKIGRFVIATSRKQSPAIPAARSHRRA